MPSPINLMGVSIAMRIDWLGFRPPPQRTAIRAALYFSPAAALVPAK
jgi:hypothetical protein